MECFHKFKLSKDGRKSICKECAITYRKEYYKKNIEKELKYKQEWHLKNQKEINKRHRNYNKENKDKIKKYQKQYRKDNKAYFLSQNAKRRAQKLNATLEGFDKEIKEIYNNCPEGYHVDHIVPLTNSKVCGLHVPWNLQYLTPEENLKKSNSFIEV